MFSEMCHIRYSYVLVLVTVTLGLLRRAYCLSSQVPALFIFGDSLSDAGNNNYIRTLAKANYRPYGIDFGEPTGRFTNGRTMIDILGQRIGVNGFIPPYMASNTTGYAVLKGVNYASGTSGILRGTGKMAFPHSNNIDMDAQLDNFANTRNTIISLKGKYGAEKLLRHNALFTVIVGSNDFIINYFMPRLATHKQSLVTPESFISILIARLRIQLETLYSLDARKFVVANVAPLGCIPFMKDTKTPQCNEKVNQVAHMFNSELKTLVSQLKRELKGSAFIYVDVNHILSHIIRNSDSYGFEETDSACCGLLGKHNGIIPCNPYGRICRDRNKYVFWDAFHPTEAINLIIAKRVLDGGAPDVSPMNVRQLLKLYSTRSSRN